MFHLACTVCSWQSRDADLSACPACGATIDVRYDAPDIPIQAGLPGIWRYSAHLPIRAPEHAVCLGEGGTPLLRSARLGSDMGVAELHFKIEGSNPTGSYKDRIAAVGIARLREQGKRAWAATSSGNAGAAIAAYGVRAGLDGYLFTLEKASRAKIAQILAYGPRVFAVERLGYDPVVEQATWRYIRTICDANGWGMLVTARKFSPHAMEGVKTIAYELGEQLGDAFRHVGHGLGLFGRDRARLHLGGRVTGIGLQRRHSAGGDRADHVLDGVHGVALEEVEHRTGQMRVDVVAGDEGAVLAPAHHFVGAAELFGGIDQ